MIKYFKATYSHLHSDVKRLSFIGTQGKKDSRFALSRLMIILQQRLLSQLPVQAFIYFILHLCLEGNIAAKRR